MTATFQQPIFTDETTAREALEAVRWPNGPVCPHCGSTGDDVARLEGKSSRPGLLYCNGCKGQFTVTVGTVFERSKIPLTKWWLAAHLLNSSKKGISAHQMHRTLGVTYKTAWFMMHRLREAVRELNPTGPLGGEGKTVEIDETYIGGKDKNRHKHKRKGHGGMDKEIAFSLVDTQPSTTASANTFAVTHIRTRLRVISRSSSVASLASTTTSARSI